MLQLVSSSSDISFNGFGGAIIDWPGGRLSSGASMGGTWGGDCRGDTPGGWSIVNDSWVNGVGGCWVGIGDEVVLPSKLDTAPGNGEFVSCGVIFGEVDSFEFMCKFLD